VRPACRKCSVELVGDRERKLGRRSRIAFLAAVTAFAVSGFASTHSAAAGVCETEVVHNYLKPLEAFPALREIPAGGELPFGPAGLFLSRRGQSPLTLPGSNYLGYTISFRQNASGRHPSPHLNWLVTAKLARLSPQGSVSEALGWSRKHIASLGPHGNVSFRLPSPGKLGFYRLEIVFRNGARDRLGRFSEYVRVLRPPTPGSRLTLNKASFLPGETVSARAEERGVGWLELNDVYSIEIYDGSSWARAPISPKELSLLIGTLIGPGEAASVSRFDPGAPCWSFTIPSGASPGLYRFVVDGESKRVIEGRLTRGSPLSLSAEFQILGG
jgi:hypothetical protein